MLTSSALRVERVSAAPVWPVSSWRSVLARIGRFYGPFPLAQLSRAFNEGKRGPSLVPEVRYRFAYPLSSSVSELWIVFEACLPVFGAPISRSAVSVHVLFHRAADSVQN